MKILVRKDIRTNNVLLYCLDRPCPFGTIFKIDISKSDISFRACALQDFFKFTKHIAISKCDNQIALFKQLYTGSDVITVTNYFDIVELHSYWKEI